MKTFFTYINFAGGIFCLKQTYIDNDKALIWETNETIYHPS